MKLLLDQGCPRSAAGLLRDVGVDALHVGEISMAAAADSAILLRALKETRVVVTLDADFHALLALNEAIAPSVVRIRIQRLRAQAMTELILNVLRQCSAELMQGVAVTVEPNKIRIRRLPLLPKI